jgi:hypothetical protein
VKAVLRRPVGYGDRESRGSFESLATFSFSSETSTVASPARLEPSFPGALQ